MKAIKFVATSLIASAISVSALAANHDEAIDNVQVNAYLNDLIKLQVQSNVNLAYRDLDNQMGDLTGSANMLVKMRHADMNPRKFDLIVKQKGQGGKDFILKSAEGKHTMPLGVYYYDETGAGTPSHKPSEAKTYVTSNGLNGDKQTSLFFVVRPENHSLAPAGSYVANLEVTVAAK